MNNTDNRLKSISRQISQPNRPQPFSGCNNAKCKIILQHALSADQLILDCNRVFYPLPYHEFSKLCCPCQNNVCNFWNDNNGHKKRISLDLFKLDIELCAALHAIASTHSISKRKIGRKWAEYVYKKLELKGISLNRAANPIYGLE